MRRAALGFLLLATQQADAKPMSVHVDAELERAMLVGEVQILEVTKADRMQRTRRGRVRVRVTRDPERLFVGFKHIGQELELEPLSFGAVMCTYYLETMRRKGRSVLLVVRRDRSIWLMGWRSGDRYRVQGFCDFNACWLRLDDKALGKVSRNRSLALLSADTLRRRYSKERRFMVPSGPGIVRCGV